MERELSVAEMLALELARVFSPVVRTLDVGPSVPAALQTLLDIAAEPFRLFDVLNDPRDLYLYCFCDIR